MFTENNWARPILTPSHAPHCGGVLGEGIPFTIGEGVPFFLAAHIQGGYAQAQRVQYRSSRGSVCAGDVLYITIPQSMQCIVYILFTSSIPIANVYIRVWVGGYVLLLFSIGEGVFCAVYCSALRQASDYYHYHRGDGLSWYVCSVECFEGHRSIVCIPCIHDACFVYVFWHLFSLYYTHSESLYILMGQKISKSQGPLHLKVPPV